MSLYRSCGGFEEIRVKVGKEGLWLIKTWGFGKVREEIFLTKEQVEKLFDLLKEGFGLR